MSGDQDQSQKTEDPTFKKLEEARKKGDAPKSQEVSVWFSLAGATLVIAFLSGPAARDIVQVGTDLLSHPHTILTSPADIMDLLRTILRDLGFAMGIAALALVVAAIAGNYIQQAPVLTTEKMKPKLSKLSPIEGAKRVFGAQALVNFVKGIAKLIIVGAIVFFVVWPDRDRLSALIYLDASGLLPLAKTLALKIMGAVVAALTVIAALDYAYQRWEWMKRQRMTKQEVKDEHKQAEGDPLVKAKLRQIRQEKARQRMMAAVPDATVVITNPTHFAVALKYETGQQGAPTCLAKGVDAVALRIREIAQEHKVPLVENKPLARALHASVEVGEEVPVEHYKAVAKVIGFVMRKAKAKRAV